MKHLLLFMIPVIMNILTTGCSQKTRFVTGSFSETGEKGIGVFDFKSSNGTISPVNSFNAGPNPSYLCIAKDKKIIYALNEVSEFNGKKAGGVTAIRYENDFENLSKAGELAVPNGGPCHLSLSPDHRFLLIASYGSGSVAVVRLDKNGIPEAVTDTIIYNDTILYRGKFNKISHPHMIDFDPQGERVYVTDLGLDRIMIYNLDGQAGKLIPVYEEGIALAPYAGPRHFVFNKTGTMLYVICELGSSVSVFRVDRTYGLYALQSVSTLREGFKGQNYSADIHISESGRFLYGTNRGENSVVVFKIGVDGLLTVAGHSSCGGDWPRNFSLDPSGRFLLAANQKSGNIAVFKIDQATGIPADSIFSINTGAPACIKF